MLAGTNDLLFSKRLAENSPEQQVAAELQKWQGAMVTAKTERRYYQAAQVLGITIKKKKKRHKKND